MVPEPAHAFFCLPLPSRYRTFSELAGVDPTDHKAAKYNLPPIDSVNVWSLISGGWCGVGAIRVASAAGVGTEAIMMPVQRAAVSAVEEAVPVQVGVVAVAAMVANSPAWIRPLCERVKRTHARSPLVL